MYKEIYYNYLDSMQDEKRQSIDKEKVLSKIDELNNYLEKLEEVKPVDFKEYESSIEKKGACERLLQIAVETIIDIANILVSNLKLGIPEDEDKMFEKLREEKVISKNMEKTLKEMKGLRNIIVHKYAEVDDELVFENLENLDDFSEFIEEIMKFIKKK